MIVFYILLLIGVIACFVEALIDYYSTPKDTSVYKEEKKEEVKCPLYTEPKVHLKYEAPISPQTTAVKKEPIMKSHISQGKPNTIAYQRKRTYTAKEKEAYERRDELKRNATRYEKEFEKSFRFFCSDYKFQHIIWFDKIKGYYCIVDFIDFKNRYIFEIDGRQHYTEEGKLKDELRTNDLNRLGYRVFRISNNDVYYGKSWQFLKKIYC